MKIAVLLTTVVLASGSALAASNSSNYDSRDTATTHRAPVVAKDTPAADKDAMPKEGIVERAKVGIRHMGQKLGHATERLRGHHASQAASDADRDDTRSMGAAGSDDSGRHRRMDDAYSNWHTRQK